MELDLRQRKLELPGGVTLWCRPLSLAGYQRWLALAHEAQQSETFSFSAAVTDAALEILEKSTTLLEGLTVRQEDGSTRPGTLRDLLALGGAGQRVLVQAAAALFKSSSLSEADLGNSEGQPTAGPAAPETLPSSSLPEPSTH